MFTEAIEKVSKFTRPIHTISRIYNSEEVIPGAATIFIVNDEGWALTCKHVVELLIASEQIHKNYESFLKELESISHDSNFETKKTELEQKYNFNDKSAVEIKNNFVDCVDKLSGYKLHVHPKYDLALIKFEGFEKLNCNEFPTFQSNESYIKQGRFLCRLGFPFPEFNNFKFDKATNRIEWTKEGQPSSPKFPIEGMVTRFLADGPKHFGIEMSVPGLKGQSGGPLFNKDGIIQGMQFATQHLHLGFDIENKEILVNGQKKQISDYSFIHLGQCIHVSVLKEFMTENGVKFNEG